jgi:hypothetical protein
MVREHGLSVREACRAAPLSRSAFTGPARVRYEGAVNAASSGTFVGSRGKISTNRGSTRPELNAVPVITQVLLLPGLLSAYIGEMSAMWRPNIPNTARALAICRSSRSNDV